MILFANQTVEEFFQNSNWQGLVVITDETDNFSSSTEELNNAHLGLTVEEYFSNSNWQGIVAAETTNVNSDKVEKGSIYSLTMSVEEFFQRMVWQGRNNSSTKTIATALPEANKNSSDSLFKTQFNLQDLSDLM